MVIATSLHLLRDMIRGLMLVLGFRDLAMVLRKVVLVTAEEQVLPILSELFGNFRLFK